MPIYKTILRRKEEIADGTMAFHFEKPERLNFQATEPSVNEEMNIKIKRAYAQPDKNDGLGILVDRLWPRGQFFVVKLADNFRFFGWSEFGGSPGDNRSVGEVFGQQLTTECAIPTRQH